MRAVRFLVLLLACALIYACEQVRQLGKRARQRGKAPRTAIAALAVSAAAFVGIAGHEAYRGQAYKDIAGVPTIGYGETAGIKMGDTTTPERALVQLLKSTNKHADGIRRCITVPLYQHEFDAYVSLAYNIGVGAFCAPRKKPDDPPSFIEVLNAGQYEAACDRILGFNQFRLCVGCALQESRGLTKRRQAERAQCLGEAAP